MRTPLRSAAALLLILAAPACGRPTAPPSVAAAASDARAAYARAVPNDWRDLLDTPGVTADDVLRNGGNAVDAAVATAFAHGPR